MISAKKILKISGWIVLFLLFVGTADAQSWQQINGWQRFTGKLGIPTKDTTSGTAADSSQIVLRPGDSTIYMKYKGYWRKMDFYNPNTTLLGNTTTGSGSTIVLNGSPTLITPSIAAINVSGGIAALPTGSGTLAYTSALASYKLANDSGFNTGFATRGRLKQYGDSLGAAKQNLFTQGLVGYISKWTSASGLDTSSIRQIGSSINMTGRLNVNGATDNATYALNVTGNMTVSSAGYFGGDQVLVTGSNSTPAGLNPSGIFVPKTGFGAIIGTDGAFSTKYIGLKTTGDFVHAGGNASFIGGSVTANGFVAPAGYAVNSGGGTFAIGASATRGVINISGSTDNFLTFASKGYLGVGSNYFQVLAQAGVALSFVSDASTALSFALTSNAATFASRVNINGAADNASYALNVNGEALINGLVVGRGAGSVNNNVAFGETSLSANTTGNNNTAIGKNTLKNTTIGQLNTAVGRAALENNISNSNNTAIGYANMQNTIGDDNTAIGLSGLQSNTTGYSNTAIGRGAGYGFSGGSASSNTTGYYNIFIGHGAIGLSGSDNNEIVIGTATTGKGSNSVSIGTAATTNQNLYGRVNINGATDNANVALNVTGGIKTSGYTVATLPTGVTGLMAYVTDALAPTYNTTIVGGGAITVPVFYNGAAWVAH